MKARIAMTVVVVLVLGFGACTLEGSVPRTEPVADEASALELAEPPPASEPSASSCDSSYPDFCIPPPPPDLDCADVSGPFTVVGSDPHRFDGDDDGVGCEG